MIEPAVLVGMRDDIPLVVRTIMAIPMIIAYVGSAVDPSAFSVLDFGLCMRVAMRRRSPRNVPLIRVDVPRRLGTVLLWMLCTSGS